MFASGRNVRCFFMPCYDADFKSLWFMDEAVCVIYVGNVQA